MKLLTEWAVTSGVLILIVLTARCLLKGRLSARCRYALWGVVLLRLLVPFQVELPAPVSDALPVLASNLAPEVGQWEEPSIPVFPERSKPVAEFNLDIETTLEPGDILSYSDVVGCLRRDGETITWYRYILSPEQIVLALWLAGAGLTGAAMLVSNLRFHGQLRKRRERLEGVDAPIPVYVTEGLPSPCLAGVLRPAVYVTPGAAEDETALRHILAHELTHYAHFDHLWSLLRCLALALHWYNPLVWLAVGMSKGDGELACDEGAVARLGEEERIPYGRTLVDMVAARSLRPGDLLSCSTAMTGGKKSITQRVSALVKKPETVKTALFAVIAVVALSAVFVFAEREEPVRNLYGPYRYQVSHTQAVQFSPSPLSSQIYPDAITDPDLLEKALEILDSAADLLNTPEELGLDLSEAPFTSPRVTLLESPDDRTSGHTYLLYTVPAVNRDWCLLVTPAEMGAESYRVAGILDVSAPGGLELLARQQRGRGEKVITPSVTPELEEFFTQLEAAQSIYVGQPSLSSASPPGLISDPVAVAQAKELLGKATGPLQLGKDITEEELLNIRRSLSSAVDTEPVHITPEELKNMLFMRGNPILLCPGPEVTPDLEFRHWLADNTLLLWDAELDENPKVLATFSEDVYSQLAELAWNEKANRAHPFTGNVGLSFLGLAPGEERVREQAFVIPENAASIQFSLTYDRPILTLEFGLRAADGTEYVQQADGGRSNGTLEAVPAGTYQIFVRNLGDLHDYTQFPAYQEDLADNYATGAINYQIAE